MRVRDDRARRPGKVRVVAAVVEIRQAARRRQLRPRETERIEDALLELLCVRASRDLLDHETERDVVRVRVALLAAGLEASGLEAAKRKLLIGLVEGDRSASLEPRRVVRDVREPRAVTEQVADRDLPAPWNDARQVLFQRAVEPKLPLLHELEHDRGRERLRHAPDAKALIRLGTAGTRRGRVLLAPDGDEDDHALRPWRYLSQHTPDGRRRARLLASGRRGHGPGGSGQPDRHHEAGSDEVVDSTPGHLAHRFSPRSVVEVALSVVAPAAETERRALAHRSVWFSATTEGSGSPRSGRTKGSRGPHGHPAPSRRSRRTDRSRAPPSRC